jgi:CubicO group peptidase (beta-lactamase class C family)
MLTFLSVCMGYERSPLTSSTAAMLTIHRRIDDESEQALGWVVTGKGDDRLIMHDGFTWGYASYVTWDPTSRTGVVVLSNQLSTVSDIGRHLLRPSTPLETPVVTKHSEIKLAPSLLDSYAGRYEAEGEGIFNILRDRDHLALQLPSSWGLPKFRIRPENRQDFFVAELPIRVTFQSDHDGHISGILLYPPRAQHALPARRLPSNK